MIDSLEYPSPRLNLLLFSIMNLHHSISVPFSGGDEFFVRLALCIVLPASKAQLVKKKKKKQQSYTLAPTEHRINTKLGNKNN
jgi:hypothetical protein